MKLMTSIRTILLFAMTCCFIETMAQKGYAWKNIGNNDDKKYYDYSAGGGQNILFQKRIGNDLFLLRTGYFGGEVNISKYDGQSWIQYPPIMLKFAVVRDIGYFNNQVYIAGSEFDSISLAQRVNDLPFAMVKFNGEKWEGISNSPTKDSSGWYNFTFKGYIDNLTEYKGKLYYISHSFTASRGALHRIYAIDKSGVHTLFKSYSDPTNDLNIMIVVHNNKLVTGGAIFNRENEFNQSISGLEFYDGTNTTLYEHTSFAGGASFQRGYYNVHTPNGLLNINDSMLAFITNGVSGKNIFPTIVLLKNETLYKDLGQTGSLHPMYAANAMCFFGNSLHVEFTWWGQETYQYNLDSNKWTTWRRDRMLFCNQAGPRIYGFRFDKEYQAPSDAKIINFAEIVDGATISGLAYADYNTSCSLDNNDKLVKNAFVEFDNGNDKFYALTDKDGKYETGILPGSYSITCLSNGMIPITTNCDAVQIVSKKTDSTFTNVNVPVHFSKAKNLSIAFDCYRGFMTRQGFTEKYILTGANYSFTADSIVMSLTYPDKCYYVSSTIQPFSHIGHVLIYKFANLEWGETKRIELQFRTSIETSKQGDKLPFTAQIENSDGDSLMSNNIVKLEQIILAAYDPNVKQSYPNGKVKTNLSKIKYVIHFQNTGTDTAYKVTVIDTITQKLGLRSIVVTSTSHPDSYSLKVVGNQALVWEFNNILLPDSHRNEKASHGYIAFEANINGKVAVGDSINNKAYIYFDYQKPVITNTASIVFATDKEVNIQKPTAANTIKLYPNPANAQFKVETDAALNRHSIQLYNYLGQMFDSKTIDMGEVTFNVQDLPKGIYFIRVSGTAICEKVVVE